MKALGISCGAGSASTGSTNSDGFGVIGRIVTSSVVPAGSTAAATAAAAACSTDWRDAAAGAGRALRLRAATLLGGNAAGCRRAASGSVRRRAVSRLRPGRGRDMVDAGRHHRDADDAFEPLVEGGADDDVGVLVDLLADAGGGFVDLVEREVACRR